MARAAEIALAISLAEAADTYRVDEGAMCAGADRLERGGADGTPLISEFLASELGPLLGLSPAATGWRIADTLNLRHRHPQLWRAFVGGEVRWWPALQVARRCAEAHLGVEAARFVDRQVAAALAVQPLGRVLRNLDRLIVAADPALARQRADEAAAFRAVGVGPARDGHVALWGTLDAADGLALDEALDAIADAMPAEVPRGHRRAAGLGELARGAFGQDPLPRHVELIVRLDRPESPAATIDGSARCCASNSPICWRGRGTRSARSSTRTRSRPPMATTFPARCGWPSPNATRSTCSRSAHGRRGGATLITRSRSTTARRPVRGRRGTATSGRSPGARTGRRRTRGGPSRSARRGSSSGPPPPATATSSRRRAPRG